MNNTKPVEHKKSIQEFELKSDIPLAINHLNKTYGDFEAVKNVNLHLRPGEIFGLLGPNGAGKTSIISCLVNLETATSGDCKIFGFDAQKESRDAKFLTGFVPQELIHHGYFDVEEILQFHSGYYGRLKNKERIDYLLNRLSLYEHRHKKVKSLSGGMKRRLLIAKALVHEPKLLLLDEPTAGVDIELRESLWVFVEELRQQGLTVLLTTHYIEEAEQLCDRVAILQSGNIRRVGPTGDLIKELTFREVELKFKKGINTSQIGRKDENSEVLRLESSMLAGDKEIIHFRIPSQMSLGDFVSTLKIDFAQVDDIKVREGRLEEALKRVLGEDSL